MRRLAQWFIRAYQLVVSPVLGNHCRFYPSCSQYAFEAIGRFGVLRGGFMALRRLSRCHPWHPGGLDPVPDPHSDSAKPCDHG
jgi:putative membrane protein insertion efficiency factor